MGAWGFWKMKVIDEMELGEAVERMRAEREDGRWGVVSDNGGGGLEV